MTTHYHAFVRKHHDDLGDGMQFLNSSYAHAFNHRHGRRDHLFGRRYSSTSVEGQGHALELVRYLAANPVRAGLCHRPQDWRWGSYAATVGLAPRPPFLSVGWWILGLWSRDERRAVAGIRRYVEDTSSADSLAP